MNNNTQPNTNITEDQQKEARNLKETFQKILPFLVPIGSFTLALALTYTPIWQLSFVVALICGFYYTDMIKGSIFGMLSIGLAWTLYLIVQVATSNISVLINQIITILTGSNTSNPTIPTLLVILILIFIACIIGALGGGLGSGIRKLIQLSKKSESATEN